METSRRMTYGPPLPAMPEKECTAPIRTRIHPTADVSPEAEVGEGAQIWHQAQVREGAKVGRRAVIGKGVYVDRRVAIGDDCKLQNYACTFAGVTLEAGVFVGPHA